MADQMMTPQLGRWKAYTDGSLGAGALCVVLLRTAETDATLRTYATLAALLAASGNVEANWTGGTAYARKTGITATATPGTALQDVDMPDQTWENAGVASSPQDLVKFLVCWRPSNAANDSAIIPLGHCDYPERANGASITATIKDTGILRAAG